VLSGPVDETGELSGLACVPLMASVEIMAEACSVLAGSTAVHVIENVRAFDWIALDDEALTLEVRAEVVNAEQGLYRATIFDGADPAVAAEFRFRPAFHLDGAAALGSPVQPSRWSGPELYTTGMFHGPVFQSVRRIAGWNEAGIDAELFDATVQDFLVPGEAPSLVLNPVLLDAVGQVAAYWIAQQAGVDFNCFPSTIARIELYAPRASGPGMTMRGRQRPLDPASDAPSAPRTWSFECVDEAGEPLLRVDGLVNVFFPVPHAFYEVRRDPLRGLLGHESSVRPTVGVALWEVPHLEEAFCAQSRAIFMRILAHAVLGADERAEWRALSGPVRRRREWLFGRAANTDAVR
jgi:hypothetical protein